MVTAMVKADVIALVTEDASAHGVHDDVTETAREVPCSVRSVTRSEFYNALNAGVRPEYVFELALAEDYEGERVVRFHGQKFRVVRTFVNDADGIEIICERSDVNGED